MTTGTEQRSALKYWRERRGMKQEELAILVKVKRPTVSLWEIGHSRPTQDQMELIADILEKPITSLFDI